MRLRNQPVDSSTDPICTGAGSGPDHAEVRAQGAALLAAADEAIARALSRDSAEFLAQNRQAGGQ